MAAPAASAGAAGPDPLRLEHAPEFVLGRWGEFAGIAEDRALVLEAVRRDGLALRFAADELRCDAEVALAAVRQNPQAVVHVAYDLFTERDTLLRLVAEAGEAALEHAPEELQDDRDVVMAAVRRHGHALRYGSPRLRRDARVVLEAVQQCGAGALDYADPGLLAGRQFLLSAVRLSPSALLRAPRELRSDEGFLLEALRVNAAALDHIPGDLFSRGFVLQAMRQQRMAVLQRAPASLCGDPQFMLQVIEIRASAFAYASESLHCDPGFALEAVCINSKVLQLLPESLKHDTTFMLRVLAKAPALWADLPEALLSNETFMHAATWQHPALWERVPEHLRRNRGFMLQAVRRDGLLLRKASAGLREDWELVVEAVRQNHRAFDFAADRLRSDWNLELVALSRGGGGGHGPKRRQAARRRLPNNMREALAEAERFLDSKLKAAAAAAGRWTPSLCANLPVDAWRSVLLFAGPAGGVRTALCSRQLREQAEEMLPQLLHTFVYSEPALQGQARRGCPYRLRQHSACEGDPGGAARRLNALFTSPCSRLLRVVDLSQAPVLDIINSAAALVEVAGLQLVRYPQTGWGDNLQLNTFLRALKSKGVAHEAAKVRVKVDRGTFAVSSHSASSQFTVMPADHVRSSSGDGLPASALAVLDALPQDAPDGHEAWEQVRFQRASGASVFRYRRGDDDIRFQVTKKKAGGSEFAAQRLARACYVRFGEGLSKAAVLGWRDEVYARIGDCAAAAATLARGRAGEGGSRGRGSRRGRGRGSPEGVTSGNPDGAADDSSSSD